MSKPEPKIVPAARGDIVVIKDWIKIYGWDADGRRELITDKQEQLCLARVSRVDDRGYVQRVTIRPGDRPEAMKGRAAMVIHPTGDKAARKRFNAAWRACGDKWESESEASAMISTLLKSIE